VRRPRQARRGCRFLVVRELQGANRGCGFGFGPLGGQLSTCAARQMLNRLSADANRRRPVGVAYFASDLLEHVELISTEQLAHAGLLTRLAPQQFGGDCAREMVLAPIEPAGRSWLDADQSRIRLRPASGCHIFSSGVTLIVGNHQQVSGIHILLPCDRGHELTRSRGVLAPRQTVSPGQRRWA
jgi:hypothetical protein